MPKCKKKQKNNTTKNSMSMQRHHQIMEQIDWGTICKRQRIKTSTNKIRIRGGPGKLLVDQQLKGKRNLLTYHVMKSEVLIALLTNVTKKVNCNQIAPTIKTTNKRGQYQKRTGKPVITRIISENTWWMDMDTKAFKKAKIMPALKKKL